MWRMYVLSCADGSFYCGITTNLERRIKEHNGGTKKKGAKYTNSRRPVVYMYDEDHPDRSSASKAEAAFKKLTRDQKIQYMVDKVSATYEEEMRNYQQQSGSV